MVVVWPLFHFSYHLHCQEKWYCRPTQEISYSACLHFKTSLSFTSHHCCLLFRQSRQQSVNTGVFIVIKCFNLQSALDILNPVILLSVSNVSHDNMGRVATTEGGVCACARTFCEHAILYLLYESVCQSIIYLSLPKEDIVYKYHPVELRVGGYKRPPTISPLFTGIIVGLTSQLLSHGKIFLLINLFKGCFIYTGSLVKWLCPPICISFKTIYCKSVNA